MRALQVEIRLVVHNSPILAEADRDGLPCHVITHNPVNVAFYERFGFSVLRQETVPRTDLFVCSLRREPVRV